MPVRMSYEIAGMRHRKPSKPLYELSQYSPKHTEQMTIKKSYKSLYAQPSKDN